VQCESYCENTRHLHALVVTFVCLNRFPCMKAILVCMSHAPELTYPIEREKDGMFPEKVTEQH